MPNDQQRPTACTATFHPSRRRCPKRREGVLGIYAKHRRFLAIAIRPARRTHDLLRMSCISLPSPLHPTSSILTIPALDAQNPGEEFCASGKTPTNSLLTVPPASSILHPLPAKCPLPTTAVLLLSLARGARRMRCSWATVLDSCLLGI